MLTNYHTHSRFCDGKGEPRKYVEYALNHGFNALGFSGHAPLPYENKFSIKDYPGYIQAVRDLQEEYKGQIDIKLGLEIDYIPGIIEDFSPLIQQGKLDYTIGSIHLIPEPAAIDYLREHPEEAIEHLWMIDGSRYEVYDEGLQRFFAGDIRRGVKTFFRQNNEMIESQRPTIVGHFDKIVMHNRNRYFQYDEPWFQSLVGETVALIKETGCICEVNTRGIYKGRHFDYYPAKGTLVKMNQMGIPVMVSTDAHQPEDLDRFEGAHLFLQEIHYREIIEKL